MSDSNEEGIDSIPGFDSSNLLAYIASQGINGGLHIHVPADGLHLLGSHQHVHAEGGNAGGSNVGENADLNDAM